MKVIEIKETILDSQLLENLQVIQKMMGELTWYAEFIQRMNKDDFDYIDIVVEKTRLNLEKIYCLLKLNHKEVVNKII